MKKIVKRYTKNRNNTRVRRYVESRYLFVVAPFATEDNDALFY